MPNSALAVIDKPTESTPKTPVQYVYFFGGGVADGNGKMKDILGGKGSGLHEMTRVGLPVPPGFTLQTEACREFIRGEISDAVTDQMLIAPASFQTSSSVTWPRRIRKS